MYSAPTDGRHVVVRDLLVVTLASAGPVVFRLIVQPAARTGQFDLVVWDDLGDVETRHLELRQALDPGERLFASISHAPVSVAITGYVFA